MRVLIAAEDPEEGEVLAYALRRSGMDAHPRPSLRHFSERWLDPPFDLLVALGEAGALEESVQALRARSEAPVVLLVEPPVPDRAVARLLQAGADLVLPTPVSPSVVALYCRNLLRRFSGVPSHALPSLASDGVSLDPTTRTVRVEGGPPRRLTPLEFRLLYTLMTHRGQAVPIEVLVERVWGYDEGGSRELVRGLVRRLRAKVEPDPRRPRYIHTVPGLGYLFDPDFPAQAPA